MHIWSCYPLVTNIPRVRIDWLSSGMSALTITGSSDQCAVESILHHEKAGLPVSWNSHVILERSLISVPLMEFLRGLSMVTLLDIPNSIFLPSSSFFVALDDHYNEKLPSHGTWKRAQWGLRGSMAWQVRVPEEFHWWEEGWDHVHCLPERPRLI